MSGRGTRWVFLVAVAAAAASEAVAQLLDVRFDDSPPQRFWQFLDPELLRTDLWGSLWRLHAQPPLMNLGAGVLLRLGGAEYAGVLCSALFHLLGVALLALLAWTLLRLRVPPLLAAPVVVLFAVHPTFVVFEHWAFYPLPIAVLVLGTGAALLSYAEHGRAPAAHLATWLAGALMLTRASYHPLWAIAAFGAAGLCLERPKRRQLWLAAVVPLLLVHGWYVKNEVVAGQYTASTWLGMNLSRAWFAGGVTDEEVDALVREGTLPGLWRVGGFEPPEKYRPFGYFDDPGPAEHPALDAPYRTDGRPNFNHREYVRISSALLRADLALIRRHPGQYGLRVANAAARFFDPGPRVRTNLMRFAGPEVQSWREVVNRILFLGSGLWLLWPAVLLYAARRGRRAGEHGPPGHARAFFAFGAITLAWLFATSNLIEIGENDRMRWEADAFAVAALGAWVAEAWRWWRARRGTQAAA